MQVTLEGIVTLSKFSQDWNASFPILVTLWVNVTLVRMEPANAKSPMLVTLPGIHVGCGKCRPGIG